MQGLVVHAFFNPSTREEETDRSLGLVGEPP